MINDCVLKDNKVTIKNNFERKPFKYVVIDDFLDEKIAESILSEFPEISTDWIDARGLHTQNKWTQPLIKDGVSSQFYNTINSPEFLRFLSYVTGVDGLLKDDTLQGAGFHQTTDGGFLDVHIDFNRHHSDELLDRRLNLIVYFNKEWKETDGGFLELWDMEKKERIESVAPIFNRCVIFETNEVSYHGHPVPVNCGDGRSRKSLSVYYYTKGRDDIERVETHNTVYVNTQSLKGRVKVFFNGMKHALRKLK